MASTSIMLSSLFSFFFLTFFVTYAQQNVTVHTICYYEGGNFTSNSSYSLNLNRLISSLPDLTPTINGFYNISTNGEVNAIALCRGDVKPNQDCITCITTAAKQLVINCPYIIEANIWFEKCMFRYTSRIILGQMEPVPFSYSSSNVSVKDKEGFSKGLGELLESLGAKIDAADETEEAKFAAGVKGSIYALAQCTPDLSESDCRICLAQIFAGVPTCCDGKAGGWWTNPSCYFRFEEYPFFDLSVISEQKQPLSPHNNNSRRSDQGNSKDRSKTLISAVVPIVTIVLVLMFLFIYLMRRKKKKTLKDNTENEFESTDSLHFDFETIRVATDDFSLTHKIGEGGFGVVYKGNLPDGQEIAVKRLSIHSGQGNAEFKTEVLLMTKLQHNNLVKLFGFSIKESERLLVYEFIPNTSLDRFLFDPIKQKQLDWEKRYNIIVGISRGLLYLHEGSEFPIIHRDLKSSNVLLDEQMLPKISDFGMARQFDFDRTQAITRRVVGTYGYMAPEYAMHGRFSVKTDVYSFGVLVLEIITGKRNSGLGLGEGTDLPTFAWQNWIEGTSMELIDHVLLKSYNKKQSMQCLEIALSCVQENPSKRPTMDSVVSMLSSDSESLQLPKPSQPGFFRRSASFSISLNDVSLTDLSAR
ncbi:Serine-threonine/tyrosine-protein kinase catalytic domain [Arabidopsis suecica]|uniref:Serine-threonine/tyrosine-protein kinase catalytic domain n=1 Tax=Arabidopsis suecica TaxID=45249 RepID=A0A8T1YL02_ARASU|nr:Serine-threonine/tyrosine-protein kinase catalytic domain [Arabidopsis suecica]